MYDENFDVEDVNVEDVIDDMDGMGHPVLTVLVSLLGGAAIGTGGTLLCKKLIGNDETKLKRKEKKLKKLKKDAEKLGIDLSSIPEVEIPTDEEIETEVEETEAEEIKKPKKGGKKK